MSTTESNEIKQRGSRELCFAVFTVLLSTLFSLGLVEYALRWYQSGISNSESIDPGLLRYHGRLGWDLSPGWQGRHRHHDFDVHYRINNDGFRGRPLAESRQAGSRRIGVLGDSFSFGLGVNDEDTFSAWLNRHSGDRFFNLSVPGYSTDQQLLLLRSLQGRLELDALVLVVYLGNDLLDNALTYPLQVDRAKPRLLLKGNSLVLDNYPVPREIKPAKLRNRTLGSVVFGDALPGRSPSLLRRSAIWRRLVPEKAAMDRAEVQRILEQRLAPQQALMRALLAAIHSDLKMQQIDFYLAPLSGRSHILAPTSYSALFQEYIHRFLVNLARSEGITLINISGRMLASGDNEKQEWYHPNEGHLTALGHRQTGEYIAEYLAQEYSKEIK